MSRKSSLLNYTNSVSWALMSDTPHTALGDGNGNGKMGTDLGRLGI